jgi:hypothetical protein
MLRNIRSKRRTSVPSVEDNVHRGPLLAPLPRQMNQVTLRSEILTGVQLDKKFSLLWNLKVSMPCKTISILGKLNPVHILTPYFFKIHFNSIFSIYACFSVLSYKFYLSLQKVSNWENECTALCWLFCLQEADTK